MDDFDYDVECLTLLIIHGGRPDSAQSCVHHRSHSSEASETTLPIIVSCSEALVHSYYLSVTVLQSQTNYALSGASSGFLSSCASSCHLQSVRLAPHQTAYSNGMRRAAI